MKFQNWSQNITAKNMIAVKIYDEQSAEKSIEWAVENGYKVRPMGAMHNWSPLVITKGTTSDDKVLLIDSSALNQISMIEAKKSYGIVKVGGGTHVEKLYQYLSDYRAAGASDNGYAFQNTPAPGDLTIAGVLAINGHGTGVTYDGSSESPHFNGSMSNNVLSVRGIVWDEAASAYKAKTFHRDDEDGDIYLTSLGRLLVTEVTMQVVPNYYLRCLSYTDISWKKIFHKNAENNAFTVSRILDKYGRMEVIWFPFTEKPWLKIWQNISEKPPSSTPTKGPYNYPFSDLIPKFASNIIKDILNGKPELVPSFCKLNYEISSLSLNGLFNEHNLSKTRAAHQVSNKISNDDKRILNKKINDIWGPAWHTLLYVRKTTLRVTANGYAIHVRRGEVQKILNQMVMKYEGMLEEYKQRNQYPVAGPLEIRVTGLEDPRGLKTRDGSVPKPPALSALTNSDIGGEVDTAIWIDALTLPGQPDSNQFYTEFEQWLYNTFNASETRVEWSKGWGYTNNRGAWDNESILNEKVPESMNNLQRSFQQTASIMRDYDPNNIYSNGFLDQLFN
ncbi:cholesterol oxidase substrate-binding domain-containing protein [Veronia nyctiphanis]|nr:cholesterol oxidase substrate-binding domain-containing protein [Veronia nyctiphanis]